MYTGELSAGFTNYESVTSGTGTKRYYKARGEGYVTYRVKSLDSSDWGPDEMTEEPS